MIKNRNNPRVLFISNNHPELYLGGAEVSTFELYKAMQKSDSFEPILLARSLSAAHVLRSQSPFSSINEDPNQVLWCQPPHDDFFMACGDKSQLTVHFDRFLNAYRPNVVHIQHTIGLGVDLIRQIKNSLPGTPIVYTLHELLPICSADGHMKRTFSNDLCSKASPQRCHDCFPTAAPHKFFLREHFIKSHFGLVDVFLTPSEFLRERYIEWGIPAEKIRFQENGRRHYQPAALGTESSVGNFGFFGQLIPTKGVLVLLEAMRKLKDAGVDNAHLFVNGANLSQQSEDFQRQVRDFEELGNVSFMGRYNPPDLRKRMKNVSWVVVPSIWWENSPLVIQEAWMHGRPVICSNVGGMAEKVSDEVNGLHFQVGDAANLAATLERAATSPALWRKLREGIPSVYTVDEAVASHSQLYDQLLQQAS